MIDYRAWRTRWRASVGKTSSLGALCLLAAAVAAIGAIGCWNCSIVDRSIKAELATKLQTILDLQRADLGRWADSHAKAAAMWAGDNEMRSVVGELIRDSASLDGSHAGDSRAAELREDLGSVCKAQGYVGCEILDPEGRRLGSIGDARVDSAAAAADVARALRGETFIEMSGTADRACVYAPIRDDNGDTIAALVFTLDPTADFRRILAEAGSTRRTYLFDRTGRIRLPSPTGQPTGGPPAAAPSDPGGQPTTDLRPPVSGDARPMARMAASAVLGGGGVDVEGYTNHRGVRVVGAWTWLPRLNLGMATEMDAREAFEPLHTLRRAFWQMFAMVVVGFVAIVLLERSRRRGSRALSESEDRFTAAFGQASVGVGLVSRAGRWQMVNDHLCERLGYARRDLLKMDCWEVLTEDGPGAMRREDLAEMLDGRGSDRFAEVECRRADGSTLWCAISISPVTEARTGRVREFVVILKDVSARRAAQHELLRQRTLLRVIVDSVPALIARIGVDHEITFSNRAFETWFGLPTHSVDGRAFREVFGEAAYAMLREPLEVALSGTRSRLADWVDFYHGGGRWVDAEFIPDVDETGVPKGCFVFLLDVTEQQLIQDDRISAMEIEQELASVRNAVDAMERVLGVVSHELRTPLASLRAMSELIMTDESGDAEQLRRTGESMNRVSISMAETIEILLDAARVNAGHPTWCWDTVDIADVCREVERVVLPLLSGPDVKLSWRIGPEADRMRGDAVALRRMLINMASNACRHTPAGQVRIDVSAEWTGSQRFVSFRVSDTGDGIDEHILHRLGEPFALAGERRADGEFIGAGLGLSICRVIAAAHGGSLSVRSSPGRGAVFTARLRADLAEPMEGERSLPCFAVETEETIVEGAP